MALFVKQTESRSELQQRIAAELQERTKNKARQDDLPDGVADSDFIKNTKQTTSLAWLWVLIGLFIVGFIIWLIIQTTV